MNEEIERAFKEEKANVIIGIKSVKGISQKELLKLYEDFYNFVEAKNKKYSVDNFYYKLNKKIYQLRFSWGSKRFKEYKDEDNFIIPKDDYGIIEDNVLIGSSDIEGKMKGIFEVKKIKKVLNELSLCNRYEDNINIKDKKDLSKYIKDFIKEKNNGNGYYDNVQDFCFTKETYFSDKENLEEFIELFFEVKHIIKDKQKDDDNKIIKVFEKDNIRLAYFFDEYDRDITFSISIPNSSIYNYFDEGRGILEDDNNLYIFDFDVNKEDLKVFDDMNSDKRRDLKMNSCFLSNEELVKLVRKDKIGRKLKETKETKEEELDNKIKSELKKNGKITLNSITRYKNGYFKYQNQKVGFKGYNIEQIDYEEKDFNEIYERVVNQFVAIQNFKLSKKLSCGDFKIDYTRKHTKNLSNMYYINDIRINQDEINEVLIRAICYRTKKEYEVFLKEVSKCSIKIHNILSSGFTFSFTTDKDEKMYSKVAVVRKNGSHYINENRISNINTLIGLNEQRYSHYGQSVINPNLIAEMLEKHSQLTYNKALVVIKDGLKDYKLSIAKAKKLLKETINQLGIKEMEIENDEYNGKGYLVKGKEKEYFVSETNKIYEYPNMRYICIVDKEYSGNLNSTDLLISRLYACANDTLLNKEIYTL